MLKSSTWFASPLRDTANFPQSNAFVPYSSCPASKQFWETHRPALNDGLHSIMPDSASCAGGLPHHCQLLRRYCLIVLRADDNGQGGTFALYSILKRQAELGKKGQVLDSIAAFPQGC
jgi:hypothetical protein